MASFCNSNGAGCACGRDSCSGCDVYECEKATQRTISDSVTTSGFYCGYLLPCGFCEKMLKECPKKNGVTIPYGETYSLGHSYSGIPYINAASR